MIKENMYNVPYADEQRCVADETREVKEPTLTDQFCTAHDILTKSCMLVDEIAGRLFDDSTAEKLDTDNGCGIYRTAEINVWLAKHILDTLNHIQRRLG